MTTRKQQPRGPVTGSPALHPFWDHDKNTTDPAEVSEISTEPAHWTCPNGPDHQWIATPRSRTYDKSGCPYCANQKVSVTNCLATVHPAIAEQWDYDRNAPLTPRDVLAKSGKTYWWKCVEGPDHSWQQTPNNRAKGQNCPYCANQRVSVTNRLANVYPAMVEQWDYQLNAPVTPNDIIARTGKKYWWRCDKGPDHVWQESPNERAKGKNCPMCSGQRVSITNCLATRNPELVPEWHPTLNGDLTPWDVTAKSSRAKVWWQCMSNTDHVWEASPASRTSMQSGCPFEAGKQVDPAASLGALHPDIGRELHPDLNPLSASEITPMSDLRAWWKCTVNPKHVWATKVYNRVLHRSGCPDCGTGRHSARETRVCYEIAAVLGADPNIHRVVAGAERMEVDFVDASRMVVVEYDGEWWHGDRLDRDRRKTEALTRAGYRVVRIREGDLEPIADSDVRTSSRAPVHEVALGVLGQLVLWDLLDAADVNAYRVDGPVAQLQAEARIRELRELWDQRPSAR
jgi:hypothetical protein